MLEQAIAKIDLEIGTVDKVTGTVDKITKQIGEIAKVMLNAAPECASKVVDGDGSIKKVYDKMREFQSGPDSMILDLIKEVYAFEVDFEIKLEIVKADKTAESQTNGKPKGNVTSIFDFM